MEFDDASWQYGGGRRRNLPEAITHRQKSIMDPQKAETDPTINLTIMPMMPKLNPVLYFQRTSSLQVFALCGAPPICGIPDGRTTPSGAGPGITATRCG